ncbi:MAG: sulfotransferase family protein [Parvibaculum sp.]|nr:sulfotransferase family protein [Parvibaculum sp.]
MNRSLKYRIADAIDPRQRVHFLHIGKTGGCTLGDALNLLNKKPGLPVKFQQHDHHIKLQNLPRQCSYFFAVRSPVSRFSSGFYSRKRKGQPRGYAEWRPSERKAFARFEHANDLAESLFAEGSLGLEATEAMLSITHVKDFQSGWIDDAARLFSDRKPVFILKQESLASDFAHLLGLLNVEEEVNLTSDPVVAHVNDYTDKPPLSAKAIENLKIWYAADMAFIKLTDLWREEKFAAAPAASSPGAAKGNPVPIRQ